MPRRTNEENSFTARVRNSEQIISMIMGVLVVLVVGGLAYRYFRNKGVEVGDGIMVEEGAAQEPKEGEKPANLPTNHTVVQDENLWRISERYYRSGYNWVDVAEENNLKNPDYIQVGQILVIPSVAARQSTMTLPLTGIFGPEIEGDRYTTQEGDSLSKIADRAYGDIFAWSKIWGANRSQISNPNLIPVGMELIIPR